MSGQRRLGKTGNRNVAAVSCLYKFLEIKERYAKTQLTLSAPEMGRNPRYRETWKTSLGNHTFRDPT